MLTAVCSQIDNGLELPKPYTIHNFSVEQLKNSRLFLTRALAKGGALQLQKSSGSVLGQVQLKHLTAFENFLVDKSKTKDSYRDIKADAEWQDIYDYAVREVRYLQNGHEIRKLENTVPCSECGVILPAKLVSVDHQRAQARDPYEAVYKIFKAVGYTEQGQIGTKARRVFADWGEQVGGRDSGSGQRTLNSTGVLVFSLLYGTGYKSNLKQLSMHHFVNLRPVCPHCNSSLGCKL